MSLQGALTGNVEIVIRSAMQTFPDRNIECPSEWTILQLKEHLNKILTFKPEVVHQRLIYAGHCLENNATIQSVLKSRAESSGLIVTPKAQVFHLVYSHKEAFQNLSPSTAANGTFGLRHRANATSSTANNLSSSTPQFGSNNIMGFYGDGQNFTQYSQNPYDYYAAYYQNYMNQMSMAMQQQYFMTGQQPMFQQQHPMGMIGMPVFPPQVGNLFAGAAAAVGTPNIIQAHGNPIFGGGGIAAVRINAGDGAAAPFVAHPFNMMNNANMPLNMAANFAQNPAALAAAMAQANGPVVAQQVGGVPAAALNPQQVDEAGGNRLDILDFIYKTVRFLLLVMVIYVYSSFERFFAVLLSISLLWFLQRQRERRNRNLLAAEQPQQDHQPNNNRNNNNDIVNDANRNDDENNNNNDANVLPQQRQQQNSLNNDQQQSTNNDENSSINLPTMSGWTLVRSTVLSFFTSLIPENPIPVN